MEKVEIVNGEFETTGTEWNKLLLVDFSEVGQKSWIRECEQIRESEKGIFLRYEADQGYRDQWFLKDNIKIVEEIGFIRKEKWKFLMFNYELVVKKYN